MRIAEATRVVLVSAALVRCQSTSGTVDASDATSMDAIAATDSSPPPDAPSIVLDPEITALIAGISTPNVTTSIQTLVGFGTRNSCSDDSGATPGIGAARDWIHAQFSAIGTGVQTQLQPFTMTQCGATITRENVLAWIPSATHPERLVVVGGHYDSRTVVVTDATSPAPGANDSGSQTSLVLELARVFAGHSFDATLVFAAFAGEEQGLVGSTALAQNIATVFPGAHVVAMLNCDIVGGDDTSNDSTGLTQFRLYSPGTPREILSGDGTTDDTSPSRGLMRYVATWGGAYVPAMTIIPELREDRPTRGGDHESFIAAGYPGVRFIEPIENLAHEHTGDDLFTYVTPAYTSRIATVVASVAASLARAPDAPEGITASGSATTSVTLGWTPPSTGAPDHYVIAARPTTANFYMQRVIVAGTATTATFGASDLGVDGAPAYFVSVAAVDASGHESLFAYPEYRCQTSSCVVQSGSLDITATN